jgi:glycosyltransferase involved in cell wall biosynthesis
VHSCAVLVVSSDGYKDLWRPFFTLFEENWPDCPFPVYLGTQSESASFANVSTLLAGKNRPWGASLRFFLEQIGTMNILLLLEDFFLSERVSNEKVLTQLETLLKLRGVTLRLCPNPPPTVRVPGYTTVGEQHRLAPFRVSLQASFWDTRALLQLLIDAESPWQFEQQGTLRAQAQPRGFYCSFRQEFPYRHVVEKGEWFWNEARRYRNLNVGCDFAARPAMSAFKAARKAVVVGLRRVLGRSLMLPMSLRESDPYAQFPSDYPLRVAFLTNLIPPYHKPVLKLLSQRFGSFRVLLSTPMESNRPWKADWGDLDVKVQNTFTFKGVWRHPRGFSESLTIHVPLDTLSQLAHFAPDVVISAEMGARTLLALAYRKLNPNSRLIIWAEAAESTESGRGLLRHLARVIFARNADAFLAVGASAVKYLQRIGAPTERIFRIAYTTSIDRFTVTPLSRSPGHARRLLFCGQFVERKGLLPFLQVLSRWAADHPQQLIQFALAGDGPLRSDIDKMPLARNVKLEFLGVFQYDDLPGIYASAGVFVLPTLADTWAVVVNEALASALPVLGSAYAQAVEELVQDGKNGWIFKPDDAQDTYSAIDRMMNTSDNELDAMRSRGRAAAALLSPDKVADLICLAVTSCKGH